MDPTNSWDFTMANYSAVWGFMVQLGLLLIFLMLGNVLRRTIPIFRKCLIPSALLGGALLLVVNIICKQFDFILVDNRLMQVITYHCLAIGFVALAYALSFGFMYLLGIISDFTNSIAWGFNFLWASLAAMLIKFIVKFLYKRKIMKREYINNYQMDRIL